METCGQQKKVASRPQLLLGIINIQNLFWRYAEINRFWMGGTKFPFYESGQEEIGPGLLTTQLWRMSLSKCSLWFGCHSVVQILASQFEFVDTPNPSWSQLSNGVSCLSWWFAIFMTNNGFRSKNGGKRFFLAAVKLHCPTSENKFSHNQQTRYVYPRLFYNHLHC